MCNLFQREIQHNTFGWEKMNGLIKGANNDTPPKLAKPWCDEFWLKERTPRVKTHGQREAKQRAVCVCLFVWLAGWLMAHYY